MKTLSLLGISLLLALPVLSQRAKNGNYTATALNTVVNSYAALTANATAGQNTLTVSGNTLTNSVLTTALGPGDLILIIQMQGASMDIDVTPTASWGGQYTSPSSHVGDWPGYEHLWGAVTNYNQCGKYEYVQVASVSGANTITLSCGLANDYTASGKVQIVRVPRFNNVTVNAAASITALAWSGTTGGVVVMEVDGNLVINANSKIEATAKGFRGGQQSDNTTAGSASPAGVNDPGFCGTSNDALASEKGEGIGGFTAEYTALYSRYGRSAPANGGGGASNHNTGGGGGSNVGTGAYTGKGIPSPAYTAIWNLEAAGFGTSSSSGGGRGGYSYSISDQNETVIGPNNTAWQGDFRRNNGGLGGHPLALDPTRIFLGGGGGAGDQNNNQGGPGGTGGGIVMLKVYGAISGAGTIEANGANGGSTNPTLASAGIGQKFGHDGAGGAGGGGAVMISHNGTIPNTLVINAIGGNGGNQNLSFGSFAPSPTNEAAGPGGGAGGGQISITAGTPVTSVAGGVSGVTNSTQIALFPPNGATGGAAGISNTGVNFHDLIVSGATLCSNGSATLTATVLGTLPAGSSVLWYTDPFGGTSIGTGLTYTTPTLNTTTTYYVGICPGNFRKPVQVVIGTNPVISGTPVITDVSCTGNSGSITGLTVSSGTPAYNYTWNGTVTTTPDLTGASAGNYTLTVTDANGCTATSGPHQINSAGGPVINTSGIVITNATCAGNNGSITGITQTGGTTFAWNTIPSAGLDITGLSAGSYTLTVTDAANCVSTAGPFTITAPAGPSVNAVNIVIQPEYCGQSNGTISGITATGTGLTYSWTNTAQTTLNITNLDAGSYTLTVTDNGGCTMTSGPHTVTEIAGPTVDQASLVIVPETCNLNNGSISGIVIQGATNPVTYSWTNTTQTTLNINNLDGGTYTLTATDANNCTVTSGPHVVASPALPAINETNVVITPESCTGNDGSVTGLTASGTGLTYSWNGTAGNLALTGVTAGIYNLVVTDANSCTATAGPYTVPGSTPLSIDLTGMTVTATACNASTGTITGIQIVGGVNPVFTWSNNATTLNQSQLGQGTYTITVNDDQGCTDSETITVGILPGPVINDNALSAIPTTCGESNGSISGLVQTSPGAATYIWTETTQTTLSITALPAGTYNLTATDANGCQTQYGPVVIAPSNGPTANFTYSPADIETDMPVSFTDASTGNIVDWTWTANGQTFIVANPVMTFASEGSYPVTLLVMDQAGCSASVTKILEIYSDLIIPNVLTRNNDGVNDVLEIKGLKPATEISILNRWGNVVYKTSDYQNNWIGYDAGGERLSNGVYTYQLKTAKGEVYQGFIHLIN